jgi:hypothetical protein
MLTEDGSRAVLCALLGGKKTSVWPTQPGVLPGHRDILEIAAKSYVSAIAVGELHRLVLVERD